MTVMANRRALALRASWELRWTLWAHLGLDDRLTAHGVFPWQPVDDWCALRSAPSATGVRAASSRQVTAATGLHAETVRRYRARGWVTEQKADKIAVRLGLHPLELWSDFYNAEEMVA